MKTKSIGAVILLWCWLFCSGVAFAAKEAPHLEIPESSYNFESVLQGQIVKHDFKLKNTGVGDLIIHKVIPGCGCTATKISSKKVPPGGESVISVEFNSTGFIGKKVRAISVETNDPKMPVATLIMEGVINPEISVEPNALSFGEIKLGSSKVLEIKIAKAAESKVTIREVSSRNNLITISRLQQTAETQSYSVSLKAEGKQGGVRGLINVTLNNRDRTTIPVPFFATFTK